MNLRNNLNHGHPDRSERRNFLKLSICVEGGLTVVALVAGWLFLLPAWTEFIFSFSAIVIGVLGTIPLLIMLRLSYLSKIQSLLEIRQLLLDLLGKPLACCGRLDMCLIALLAGVSEECLFRGVLEPLIGRWNSVLAFAISNLIFGICHAVTPMYFVYATLMGCYLSWSFRWTSAPNLVIPTTIHALYDLAAFAVIRSEYIEQREQNLANEHGGGKISGDLDDQDLPQNP